MPIFTGGVLAIICVVLAVITLKALFEDNNAFLFITCLVISIATGFGAYYSFGATS